MRVVLSILTSLIIFIPIIEYMSYVYLKDRTKMEPYSLFYDSDMASKNTYTRNLYAGLDPLLGYSHHKRIRYNLKKHGMYRSSQQTVWHINKAKNCIGKDLDCEFSHGEPIVAVVGGSTTDAYAAIVKKRRPWSTFFADSCQEKFDSCQVANMGVGGFGSAQEVIKLIRDVAPLNFTHVIALHGPNELNRFRHRHLTAPMINQYKKEKKFLIKVPVLPNLQVAFRRFTTGADVVPSVYFGNSSNLGDFEHWKINVQISKGAMNQLGVQYFTVLQPIIGYGRYQSPGLVMEKKKSKQYFERLNDFYEKAVKFCESVDYCIDLTDLYDGSAEEVFNDPRHPNDLGNKLLGRAIFDKIDFEDRF